VRKDAEAPVWIITGTLGSIALGVALILLRSHVSASNLAFVFMAFTILVAELGGRGPALVTALMSALSLNFFLTEPYLTLTIEKREDVIAFFALAGCGLIAAAFGRKRERLSEVVGRTDRELAILGRFAERALGGRSLGSLLEGLRTDFGLGGLVLRDATGRVVAAAPEAAGSYPAPRTALTADTLFAPGDDIQRFGGRGLRLPDGGGRLTLQTAQGQVTLDLWEGDVEGFSPDESRTLAITASILGLRIR
jgi:two-component system sensor histidine kinase KdpD